MHQIEHYKLKFDILSFDGHLNIEDFLDWLQSIEMFFECVDILKEKQVKLVAYMLKGAALAWWEQLQSHCHCDGKPPVCTWHYIQQFMSCRFLPTNYDKILFSHYQNCQQHNRSIDAYTKDFYRLNARIDIHESESQQVSFYISGLQEGIQD